MPEEASTCAMHRLKAWSFRGQRHGALHAASRVGSNGARGTWPRHQDLMPGDSRTRRPGQAPDHHRHEAESFHEALGGTSWMVAWSNDPCQAGNLIMRPPCPFLHGLQVSP